MSLNLRVIKFLLLLEGRGDLMLILLIQTVLPLPPTPPKKDCISILKYWEFCATKKCKGKISSSIILTSCLYFYSFKGPVREVVAIKCIAKSGLTKSTTENLLKEIEIMKTVHHEFIVELKNFVVSYWNVFFMNLLINEKEKWVQHEFIFYIEKLCSLLLKWLQHGFIDKWKRLHNKLLKWVLSPTNFLLIFLSIDLLIDLFLYFFIFYYLKLSFCSGMMTLSSSSWSSAMEGISPSSSENDKLFQNRQSKCSCSSLVWQYLV